MKRLLALFVIVLIAFLVSSCSLKVPNILWCRDSGSLGAFCAETNTEVEFSLSKSEWDERRFGQFCTDEKGFAKNQQFIEEACERVKGCDIEKLRAEYMELIGRF